MRIHSSAPAAHEFASGHEMDVNNTKLMHSSTFAGRCLLVESALMAFKSNNVNVKAPTYVFNSFTLDCMIKSSKSIMKILCPNPD